jgi:hypothetical protein
MHGMYGMAKLSQTELPLNEDQDFIWYLNKNYILLIQVILENTWPCTIPLAKDILLARGISPTHGGYSKN